MLTLINQGILPLQNAACKKILIFKVQPFWIICVRKEIWRHFLVWCRKMKVTTSDVVVIGQLGLRKCFISYYNSGVTWLLIKPQPRGPLRQGDPVSLHGWGGGGRGKDDGGKGSPSAATETPGLGPEACPGIAQMKPLVTGGRSEESWLLEAGFSAPRWRMISIGSS